MTQEAGNSTRGATRGNIIATVLVIVALLASAGVFLLREQMPLQHDVITESFALFRKFVFSGIDDILVLYARNGYTKDNSLWYCKDTPSYPELSQTVPEFSSFAHDLITRRLRQLLSEKPGTPITITDPRISLVGASSVSQLPDTTVTVTIKNFNVTVQDGNTKVTNAFDGDTTYNYRFWLLYKTLQDWTACNAGGVFNNINTIAESRYCAFFKDICPQQLPETCPSSETDKVQDFTTTDRQQLVDQYGLKSEDVETAVQGAVDELNKYFSGQSTCAAAGHQSAIVSPTSITCSATIIDQRLKNRLWTTYAYHPGCADRRPLIGACAIVPYDAAVASICGSTPGGPSNGNGGSTKGGTGGGGGNPACGTTTEHGETGSWPNAPPFDDKCNSLGRGSVSSIEDDYYSKRLTPQGQAPFEGFDLKCMADSGIPIDSIHGAVGFMDTSGEFTADITCIDPGQSGAKMMTAKIRIGIAFRHVCGTDLKAKADAIPCGGAPNVPHNCHTDGCPQNPSVCGLLSQCVDGPNGPTCEPGTTRATTCSGPDPCKTYRCVYPSTTATSGNCQENSNVADGSSCSSNGCKTCQAGSCMPVTAPTSCAGGANPCMKYMCDAGACVGNSAPMEGTTCATLQGCTAKCVSGTCEQQTGGTCTGTAMVNCQPTTVSGTCDFHSSSFSCVVQGDGATCCNGQVCAGLCCGGTTCYTGAQCPTGS